MAAEDDFYAQIAADDAAAAARIAAEDAAFRAQQDALDQALRSQLDIRAKADADAFAKAQADISFQLAAEQQRMAETAAQYAQQQAAIQAAAAQATREAEIAQAEIAKQIAETQRLSVEMAAKSKADMEGMQRTSAAKIAGSRKAGRSAGDRSLLSAYSPTEGGPPTLGTAGGLGGPGSGLAVSQTLGVG
jgi:hypothetical protein